MSHGILLSQVMGVRGHVLCSVNGIARQTCVTNMEKVMRSVVGCAESRDEDRGVKLETSSMWFLVLRSGEEHCLANALSDGCCRSGDGCNHA